jgi:hypothetical protein
LGASSSEIVLIMGLPPEVVCLARHGSRVTSDTVQLRPPSSPLALAEFGDHRLGVEAAHPLLNGRAAP